MPRSTILTLALSACLHGQTADDWKRIVERLDRLEAENKQLKREVRELRTQVGPPPVEEAAPNLEERAAVQEKRVEEHEQTKVETAHKSPLRVSGMALMNTFYNTRHSNGNDTPTTASLNGGRAVAGASVRQSVIGLEYTGSPSILGGTVKGSIFADFFDGPAEGATLPWRLRTASIEIGWKSRSITVGVEKPIFNPREPNSLMQVGISPYTSSGNLWRWIPQARFDQRFQLGANTKFTAQVGVVQTLEDGAIPVAAQANLQRRRPGAEGRFLLSHAFGEFKRIEVAPGFHASTSHLGGQSAPSNLFSLDWFVNPLEKLEITGVFFKGQNTSIFGALRQGFRVLPDGRLLPIGSAGGWSQLSYLATGRLTFNVLAGVHDDRNGDLLRGMVEQNRSGSANAMFRIAPNVVVSFEAMQTRTRYFQIGQRLNNRYDLAIAYMF